MVLHQNLSALSFSSGGGWGGAGRTGTELRCSFAEQPPQNLLSNCSISGCSLSPSAYILSFGVPQSLKMCASHLQTAKKGEKCLKYVCVWCFRTFFTDLFFYSEGGSKWSLLKITFAIRLFLSFRFTKRANFCRNHTGPAFHMSFEKSSLISFRVSPAGIIVG